MCGFAGAFTPLGRTVRDPRLSDQLDQIAHRGPDGRETVSIHDGRFEAGFVRLAIIDLETGDQPLRSANGRHILLGNGEIYNYREIRDAHADYAYASQGDMETVLAAQNAKGDAFVHDLNGMFALALYDSEDHALQLIRDRLGIKPLYWAQTTSGTVLFASEPKAILASGLIKPRINRSAIGTYLVQSCLPGTETLFEGIHKVPPGHRLSVSADGRTRLEAYWQPGPASDQPSSPGDRRAWIEDLLRSSVSLQLRSDVPLGALLSGGIDSGLVVALAAQAQSQPLNTFTVRFDGADYDESPLAQAVADRYGTRHQTISVSATDAQAELVRLAWYMDDPVADAALAPNALIEQVLARHVTVALNGTGGDELFAGYGRYFPHGTETHYAKLPGAIRRGLVEPLAGRLNPETAWRLKRLDRRSGNPGGYINDHTTLFPPPLLDRLGFPGPIPEPMQAALFEAASGDLQTRQLISDLPTYLAGNLLPLLDRTTMMVAVEGRVPLLDHRLVEAALSLDAEERTPGGRQKGLLRDIAADHLPEAVLNAPKRGFASPVPHWMANGLADKAANLLTRPLALDRGFWTADGIRHLQGRGDAGAFPLYALLMLELGLTLHVEGKGGPEATLDELIEA
ncbi:MAG: asparagine synthase (glutamine-hydrolyzing) [Magnetovibrionaceae bacterium]